jgi:BirA family biotin operon repressor/biotin-[acetyl-CoA-carboxylase] ligase
LSEARFRLLRYETLPSTNAEALRLAADGAPDRTAVLADIQTEGRGRRGRVWRFAPGNLALSIIVEGGAGSAAPGLLALAVGVAAAEACSTYGVAVCLKWPNDLMIDDAKLGGVLIEAAPGGRYVVGIGVNLAAAPPIEGRKTVALAEACRQGGAPDRDAFLGSFAPHLTAWVDRWVAGDAASIRTAWLARAHGLGQTISLMNGTVSITGIFNGLAEDGALRLTAADGERLFHAGEIMMTAR